MRPWSSRTLRKGLEGQKFNSQILNAVRTVENRIWNDTKKIWLIPSNQKSINSLLANIYRTKLFNADTES
ncbi:MAG: hypothetical protein K6C97_02940, partial [Treponema sp.]|nr:hypothetical protein [Treponema sp.]